MIEISRRQCVNTGMGLVQISVANLPQAFDFFLLVDIHPSWVPECRIRFYTAHPLATSWIEGSVCKDYSDLLWDGPPLVLDLAKRIMSDDQRCMIGLAVIYIFESDSIWKLKLWI